VKAYPFLLSPYAFSVARIQPDNNIEMMLKAFSSLGDIPFVIVGNWQESK
jgi:glycosyltransferase involved in cell wall biosynthesis